MRVATAPTTMAGMLAPSAASADARTTDTAAPNAAGEPTGGAFDAMLSSLVGPSTASAMPTPVVAETEQVVDRAEASGATDEVERETAVEEGTEGADGAEGELAADAALADAALADATLADAATADALAADAAAADAARADATGAGDRQTMETLHYGLRTDAQLATPRASTRATRHATADERRATPEHAQGRTDGAARSAARRDGHAATHASAQAAASRDASQAADAVAHAASRHEPERVDATLPAPGATLPSEAASVATPGETPAPARPAAPTRDVDALAPELQARLERVMERMRDEFGHEVEIVETHRPQERQDALFAQGRTRPGPVVTWTRTSKHTSGLAVDVRIDGGWDDADAFATLQRVAREEGLKTLGPRDAGHLELPRHLARELAATNAAHAALRGAPTQPARDAMPSDATTDAALDAAPALPAPRAEPAQVAQVARVADVADVAEVASVASVASVADVAPTAPVAAPVAQAVREAAQGTRTDDARAARQARATSTRTRRDDAARDEASAAPGAPLPTASLAAQASRVAPVAAPALGAAAVERLTSVTDRMEAAAASRGVSHLTLRVDNALGGQDHIRIDLRGTTVDTDFAMGDASMAERLGSNMGELRQALERQGLTADTVRISSAGARAAEAASASPATPDAGRVAAAAGAQTGAAAGDASGSSSQSQHQQSRESQQTLHRDAQQQHSSRDGRRGHDAEPWLADEFTPRGRTPRPYGAR
jgi:hypothetical protein